MKKPIKKRGYHWFRMLTKKQKKQYKENIKNFDLIGKDWMWWYKIRMNQPENAYLFIILSFDIDKTPQGRRYWSNVADRIGNN